MLRILLPFVLVPAAIAQPPATEDMSTLKEDLASLLAKVATLESLPELQTRDGRARLADVAVFAKAVEWQLRHNEFPKKDYAKQAAAVLQIGQYRADMLERGEAPWESHVGATIRGYFSRIDGSVQPYALRLPEGVDPQAGDRWPLHVKLHGRANDMNETNFIFRHEGKKLPTGQSWIQLDVYGRGNNAYRWAGETDVLEAIADVRRRFRIDDNRITLHGFSMGGAGAWHLGLHFPAMWSSVGPGAGFVDFYKYQKQTAQLPAWQHATLGIYDAIDYSLNAANVPICTYGGENDSQLVASTSVVESAEAQGVDIKLLIGPGMGHKFHPDSFKEFMAFHREKSEAGRQRGFSRKKIRFTTKSLRYNSCDWLAIEEVEHVYQPSTVEAELKDGNVEVSAKNVAVLSIARDAGTNAIIDGDFLPCYNAAEGLLPNVYYEKSRDGWAVLSYEESKAFQENRYGNKRRGLQGPIDDAFMDSFVCVLPTGKTQATVHREWSEWTFQRFAQEFDKWMRARVPVVNDSDLSKDKIRDSHLILFGDPSSNSVLADIVARLPIAWTGDTITVARRSFSVKDHGVSLIYPNPLNRRKYVVINSGHTFHEPDFRNSNSWLFPRLGDIAIQRFEKKQDGGFAEETVWAENFNAGWKLPVQ